MAKYWIYINEKVLGPYELDELIRVPGFSRQTPVSVDNYSGKAGEWISPANIPDLARIFQKADELHDAPAPAPRSAPKPRPKMPARLTPVAPPADSSKHFSGASIWGVILASFIGIALYQYYQWSKSQTHREERAAVQNLIETRALPATSQYATLRHYLEEKQLASRWEFERTPSELYNVTVSWPALERGAPLPLYAFEANLQAQSVRGLNTAGVRLLSEGFARPVEKIAKPAPAKAKKSPGDVFPGAINDRRQAFERGEFEDVWEAFSRRRQKEMQQGGISESGFIRMQKLTYRPNSGLQQTILKTQQESDTSRLVLLRQSQPKHPDIFVKQSWVWEEDAWRLDGEEKRAASVPASAPSAADAVPPAETAKDLSPTQPSLPAGLPGLSDPAR